MEVISFVALAAGLMIGLGIALWFATANPFLAQIANLPK